MKLRQENPKKQGDIGLGAAIGWFTLQGYTVCVPLTDSQAYDLVVDGPDGIQRVQVKTTTYQDESGAYQAHLRVNGGNRSGTGKSKHFSKQDADMLFILCESGDQYLVPAELVDGQAMMNLGEKYKEYKI